MPDVNPQEFTSLNLYKQRSTEAGVRPPTPHERDPVTNVCRHVGDELFGDFWLSAACRRSAIVTDI